jgi:hypothetical protein
MLTIVLSIFYKTPQIYLILENNSTRCVTLFTTLCELFSYTFNVIYNYRKNYDFYNWGENASTSLQLFMILLLVLYYNNEYYYKKYKEYNYYKIFNYEIFSTLLVIFFISISFVVYFDRFFNVIYLYLLQIISLILYLLAISNVIIEIYKQESIGNLSRWTILFQFLGSIIKWILQFFGTRDIYLLIGYGLSTFLSAILYYQTRIYKNKL